MPTAKPVSAVKPQPTTKPASAVKSASANKPASAVKPASATKSASAVTAKSKPAAKSAATVKPGAGAKSTPAVKAAPAASSKPTVAAKAATKPATGKPRVSKTAVTPEERYQMIAKAAYFRAEKRGFATGDTARDWLEAEAEIDRMLQTQKGKAKSSPSALKQAFQQELETQIHEWDLRIADLKTKAQGARADIRTDYEKQFEILTKKRDAMQTKIHELRARAGDAWEDLKGGTEKAWEEMQKALDQMAGRFK